MKVLASTLAGLAIGQDRWTGFDYDYGFGTAERNQISQSSTINTLMGQGAGYTSTNSYTSAGDLGALFNPWATGSDIPAQNADNMGNIAFPTYLGNGMMCWHCDSESVFDCFNSGQFQVCYGQDYFCYFHERRKIGHYFNRREKYIDNHESLNTDLFLVRVNNEAWNLDNNHNENDTRGGETPSTSVMTDDTRPKTDIHVMAGCQQPQACLRQQMQNQAINIGVAFYGDEAREIGNLHTGTTSGDFQTYIHPTSRRNVREGLCRLGKDWTYYSGKLWHYDFGGKYRSSDMTEFGGSASCSSDLAGCYYTIDTIEKVNSVPIIEDVQLNDDAAAVHDNAMFGNPTDDVSTVYNAAGGALSEATAVFGRNDAGTTNNPTDLTDDRTSPLLWGRGIYDAHDAHGHQFWHERESWYNGMRPNGFPDQHYHGGKGTESVCHFCCNPASSDGMFCNRRLLDSTTSAIAQHDSASNPTLGVQFSNGAGNWYRADANYNAIDTSTPANSDERNRFIDPDFVRADDPNLNIMDTPMANSYNTSAAWLAEHRFHGMFRNPETQVSQEYMDPYFPTTGR